MLQVLGIKFTQQEIDAFEDLDDIKDCPKLSNLKKNYKASAIAVLARAAGISEIEEPKKEVEKEKENASE